VRLVCRMRLPSCDVSILSCGVSRISCLVIPTKIVSTALYYLLTFQQFYFCYLIAVGFLGLVGHETLLVWF
jgi:hypothetical protein